MTKAVKAPLRGDVVILDFNPQAGHEQAGTRPALVISADIFNATGGRVQEAQFTGSRAAMRYSHMIFGFERNKGAVDPDCSYLCLIKNRKYGRTCRVKTYYSQRTGRLKQRNWDDESYADKASASTKAASN